MSATTFLVVEEIPFEGISIAGCYTNRPAAEAHAAALTEANGGYDYCAFSVREMQPRAAFSESDLRPYERELLAQERMRASVRAAEAEQERPAVAYEAAHDVDLETCGSRRFRPSRAVVASILH